MGWISIDDGLPEYSEETVIHILLKDDEKGLWGTTRYDQLLEKAWWIPQRQAFVVDGFEHALHMITHWQPLPDPPKK